MSKQSTFQLQYTQHAQKRMAQRGISKDLVALVIRHGRETMGRNALLYFIGTREVQENAHDQSLRACQNIHVVMDWDGVIRTVYRNSQPNLKDKRKKRAKRIQRRR